MKKVFLVTALLLFHTLPAMADGLLVIQSLRIKPYDDALRGFRSICTSPVRKLFSADASEADIAATIRRNAPDLILAIGLDALNKVKSVRNVPIVYVMVLNPQPLVHDSANITGVSLAVQADRQLAMVRRVLPHARVVGFPFDPDKSGAFARNVQAAAAAAGIKLLTRKVHSSREAVKTLEEMKGEIDALWLPPDTTVMNPGTIDLLILSAGEKRIPVFTFSRKYVEKGALFSMEVDAAEAGRQAGEMANRILAGAGPQHVEKADAREGVLSVNPSVAKKLGISLSNDALKHAVKVQQEAP